MRDIRLKTTQEYSNNIIKSLVGVPYDLYDCWGIVKMFYELHGIELPEYYETPPNDSSISAQYISEAKSDYQKVEGLPEYGDIVLIKVLGLVSHCGVYVGNGLLLHTRDKINCTLESLKRHKPRIAGIYRFVNDKT